MGANALLVMKNFEDWSEKELPLSARKISFFADSTLFFRYDSLLTVVFEVTKKFKKGGRH